MGSHPQEHQGNGMLVLLTMYRAVQQESMLAKMHVRITYGKPNFPSRRGNSLCFLMLQSHELVIDAASRIREHLFFDSMSDTSPECLFLKSWDQADQYHYNYCTSKCVISPVRQEPDNQ